MIRAILLLSLITLCTSAKEFSITSIAATVNGHAITKKEVETLLAPRREVLETMFPRKGENYHNRLSEFRERILDQLINNELLLSEVEGRANIPDHVVEQEISRIIREDYDGKEDEFNNFLRENGLTRRSFREQQREQILVQAYRSQQFSEIPPPTEQEVQARYDERKLAMRDRTKDIADFRKIFLIAQDRLDPNITPETQLALADKIMLEIKGGADFAEMAKKHSNGAFASKGGLWEDSKRTDFSLAFGDVIFEDSVKGDLVGPLSNQAGFTIVKIIDIHYGPTEPLSNKEVRERMKREVNIEKRTEKYDKWIVSLKKHAMIDRKM